MIRLRRLLALAGLLLGVAAPGHADTCAPATSAGAAPADWRSYCWLNFAGYDDATARSAGGVTRTLLMVSVTVPAPAV
jgi:hypothetical protein